MNRPPNKLPWSIGVGLLLLLLTLGLLALLAGIKSRLPGAQPLPVISQVSDFTLTNQNGAIVSLADLRGRVWVADIIFTRCPGPCWTMTRRMKELQDALPVGSEAKLVTLTTDPVFDTPEILRAYAERAGADTNRWLFLTGTKGEIGKLAIDGLKLTAVEKKPEERESENDLFIHSTIFVVVDSRGQLRGVFETQGEGVDWPAQKQKILSAVRQLERAR